MKQYLNLVSNILENGLLKPSRTGIDTISYFGCQFRHDLADGFPLLTTKKMSGGLWNSMVHELLWFISGKNHIRDLQKHTKIWDDWADESGNLQSAYGFYWRNYPYAFDGKMYRVVGHEDDWGCGNFDQLGHCVKELKSNPTSRRLVVLAWEPYNAHLSKLPACHMAYVFNVQDDRLCLHMTQRSVDMFLGFPFNIASYALLTHIIAREVGLKPGVLCISLVDAHIYYAAAGDKTLINGVPRDEYDHSRVLREQLTREPLPLPKLMIHGGSWENHKFEDFELIGYQSHPSLKARVAV